MIYMKPVNIGDRRELFVDDELFLTTAGCRFIPHRPVAKEIAIERDGIADDAWTSYYTIIHNGEKYLMYYTAHGWPGMNEGDWPHQHICRAESYDGLHWERPNYNIYEFKGTKENNIVYLLKSDLLDNFGVMYDTNPNCPENQRYKALTERVYVRGTAVLNAVFSADGIHWEDQGTVITDGTFDTLNTCYYDPRTGLYHAYVRSWEEHDPGRGFGETRLFPDRPLMARTISTFVSKDFINWEKGERIEYGNSNLYQLYTNNIAPYYRAPHYIFGFPTRYYARNERKRIHYELPSGRFKGVGSGNDITTASDGLFMASRDGIHFNRFDEFPIFPSGIEGKGNWIYGDGYASHGLYETPSDRPDEPNNISILCPDYGYNGAMRRYEIRLDGFVSLHAGSEEQVIKTKPFIFEGNRLEFNYKTTVAGYFYVEFTDEIDNPIPGFEMKNCEEMFGDTVKRDVSWNFDNFDVSPMRGKPVSMKIKMRECDLFSFRFYTKKD